MDTIDSSFMESAGLSYESILGKGGYGSVFKVFSQKYNQSFALKRVTSSRFNANEVECMKMIQSNAIVPLYEYHNFEERVYMIMEHCQFSLDHIISLERPLKMQQIVKYAEGIVRAVKVCHDNMISHGDIKPSNFLIDNYGRVKICDFGLSKHVEENEHISTYSGTIAFLAPEILNKVPYDPFKADIWAIGVTLYFLATGKLPWCSPSISKASKLIKLGLYNSNEIPKELRDIVCRCLLLDPKSRPTCEEILKHSIFKENSANNITKLTPQIRRKSSLSIIVPKRLRSVIIKPSVLVCV